MLLAMCVCQQTVGTGVSSSGASKQAPLTAAIALGNHNVLDSRRPYVGTYLGRLSLEVEGTLLLNVTDLVHEIVGDAGELREQTVEPYAEQIQSTKTKNNRTLQQQQKKKRATRSRRDKKRPSCTML